MKKLLMLLFVLGVSTSVFAAENGKKAHATAYTEDSDYQIVKRNVTAVRFVYNSNTVEGKTTVTIIRRNGQLLADYGDVAFASIVYESDKPGYSYCFKLSGVMYYFNL